MRLVTFQDENSSRIGLLLGENVLDLSAVAHSSDRAAPPETMLELISLGQAGFDIVAELAEEQPAEALLPLSGVTLLAPIPRPTKNIFCLGLNYAAHAAESNNARNKITNSTPDYPTLFTKTPTTVNAPEGDVVIDPNVSTEVDWEVELGVIIGREGKNIGKEDALSYVFGYTVINDVSARDIQVRHGGQFFKGKSIDGYCPMGPCIVTADEIGDPQNLRVQTRVNGETKQDSNTHDMIFDVATTIYHLSLGTTLEPGDIIATGTPAGVGFARNPPEFLQPGDMLETEIEKIGVLRNKIVAA